MNAKLQIVKTCTHIVGPKLPDKLKPLLPRMSDIYRGLFGVREAFEIDDLLKFRGDRIALSLFYGEGGELGGFAIAGIQTLADAGRTYAVFSAGAYSDLRYDVGQNVARFALTQSLKYKILHPTHELAYLCEALSPAPYSLASRILPECYPHPNLKTPAHVTRIIESLSKQRNFTRHAASDFVVSFPFERVLKDYGKLLNSQKMISCEKYNFYLKLNPGFRSGTALLVYMPLSLKNLAHGVKNYSMEHINRWRRRHPLISARPQAASR